MFFNFFPLDSGGSGTKVFSALINGWKCCVKELPLISSSEEQIAIFKEEVRILQTLPEHHIVQYLGFQRTKEHLQIFMTLYDGSLFDLLKGPKRRKLSCKQISRIGIQILRALSVLHSRRLIHRDIKSPNVMFEGDPEDFDQLNFFLGDFGEAKVILAPQSPKRLSFSGKSYYNQKNLILMCLY